MTAEETDRLNASLAEDENRTAAQVITLLLLTGTRRREITLAKWEQVGEPGMRAACVAGTRPEIRILSRDQRCRRMHGIYALLALIDLQSSL